MRNCKGWAPLVTSELKQLHPDTGRAAAQRTALSLEIAMTARCGGCAWTLDLTDRDDMNRLVLQIDVAGLLEQHNSDCMKAPVTKKCPVCGKQYVLTKDGLMRSHKGSDLKTNYGGTCRGYYDDRNIGLPRSSDYDERRFRATR